MDIAKVARPGLRNPVGKVTFPLEKNERKTGIIVKIQYGRCHGKEAGLDALISENHVPTRAPGEKGAIGIVGAGLAPARGIHAGAIPRTRLNIVITTRPDRSGT